jgi:uncharacterized protein YggE
MRSFALAACVVLHFVGNALAQPAAVYDPRAKIAVTGEAVVLVEPNKIIVNFGIETRDRDLVAAKQRNNELLKKAVAAIKECGIAESSIQTDHLSIEPRYRDNYVKEDFIAYFVRNNFSVTLNQVGKVEDLITKALLAGVNNVHGVEFQTTDFKKHRENARRMALEAAREKAVKMAAVLGQAVGKPIQIDEHGGGWWYSSGWRGSGRDYGMTQNRMQETPGQGSEISDTIALGKIGIRANVSVVFALVDP